MAKIEFIKKAITRLQTSDVIDLNAFIAQHLSNQALQVALTKRAQTLLNSPWPQCGFTCLMRWGASDAGTQRFKCRNCKATFGATNDTPFFRLRNRHLWTKYLGLMGRHIPLKALPAEGIGLSLPTLHRWRHRFLSVLVANPETKLAGLIEADEKYFRTSFKGSRGWKRKSPPQARKARRRAARISAGLDSSKCPS
jgi:transposase-like protein